MITVIRILIRYSEIVTSWLASDPVVGAFHVSPGITSVRATLYFGTQRSWSYRRKDNQRRRTVHRVIPALGLVPAVTASQGQVKVIERITG